MDAQLRKMLNDTEQELIRSTEPRQLNRLDEDDLAALHDRVRRARNKYSKLYRRRAADQVAADRSRKRAHEAHAKAARKAEGFEDALARVSRRLADVAAAAAEELKAERLSAAQRPKRQTGAKPPAPRKAAATGRSNTTKQRTPASEKTRASAKAANQRKQTARDRRP